jgi:alpha-glucosidase (family GH31 glycosyl hydrolase)
MLETNEELCARWIQAGAYYPFSRNHNTKKQPAQELYLWPSVTESAKKALTLRYMLLPYMYTLFAEAHENGTPVVRSLWMNYPQDDNCVDVDEQFMLGANVLVSPVLYPKVNIVKAYFPAGVWYPVSAGNIVYDTSSSVKIINAPSTGRHVLLPTPATDTNVHVRGGSILPLQQPASTTTVGRQTPFTLLVSLSHDLDRTNASSPAYTAHGALFWDDGEQLTLDVNGFLHAHYDARVSALGKAGIVSSTLITNTYAGASDLVVDRIIVNGVRSVSMGDCEEKHDFNVVIGRDSEASRRQSVARAQCNKMVPEADVEQAAVVQYTQFVFENLAIPLRSEFTFTWKPSAQ